jgi:hypothetical protein
VIIKVKYPHSVWHFLLAQVGQAPDGLAGTRDILDIHEVEVHLPSRVSPLGLKGLETQVDLVHPGNVSNSRGKGQLMEIVSHLCLSFFQSVEVLVPLLSNWFALQGPIGRVLALLQLLEGLYMLLLELP